MVSIGWIVDLNTFDSQTPEPSLETKKGNLKLSRELPFGKVGKGLVLYRGVNNIFWSRLGYTSL